MCLVGPSGCGKSTLLNLIAGLDTADSGDLVSDGQPITGTGRERMVMFQEHALFPWLDVIGNVLFGLKLKPNLTHADRVEVARYYLQLVGLERFAHANVHELSGGMRQRVSLARAPCSPTNCSFRPGKNFSINAGARRGTDRRRLGGIRRLRAE